MKKLLKLLVVLSALCFMGMLAVFSACNKDGEPELKSFKIDEVYEEFKSAPQYIEVRMSGEYRCNFTVDDKDSVNEIYSYVCGQTWYLSDGDVPPGNNNSLKFVFGNDKSVSIG